MAKVQWMNPIQEIHGKIVKTTNVSFRGQHTYHLQHPRTEKDFSEHEKAYRRAFGELNKEASRINKDPDRWKDFQDWKEKGYTSRYRYILAELINNTAIR